MCGPFEKRGTGDRKHGKVHHPNEPGVAACGATDAATGICMNVTETKDHGATGKTGTQRTGIIRSMDTN